VINTEILENLLELMLERGGSDLHIKSQSRPCSRISGELDILDDEIVTHEQINAMAQAVLGDKYAQLEAASRGVDGYYVSGIGRRYRANFFLHVKGMAAVFRVIAENPKSFEELNLPKSLHRFSELSRGLVLVTGTTGSGKSTTLSAIIEHINAHQARHIITIEDPVELIYTDKRSLIEQRNIGEHVESFSKALKDALREDPDIILVGEMRDIETIEMALHAANTGHLVFSTLHTLDAKETVSRIISVFSEKEQNQARTMLASVLQGVISQRLLKSKNAKAVAAVEVMICNERVRHLIMEGRENELLDVIEESSGVQGMQSFDQALLQLYLENQIDKESMLHYATSPSDLALRAGCTSSEECDFIALKEVEVTLPEQQNEKAASSPKKNLLQRMRISET
jgi:twitching motility protein PilT